ncbi:LANO_0C00452g1_1 [Lachancea nothofagi CBS 11611]|uniref:LANO_0C00452g1_1 n=1 Tax=Lachancea nothofagi CBS 11611 TaxID=1266666 RepID=A0A1G4J3M0_9SACH|nr:LANO_0C00452g1_1 [Lachancea nothofagi CBS 11611]
MSNSDGWGKHAGAYRSNTKSGPPRDSVRAILAKIDSLLPFEEATSILDNGCGTGIGIEVLIEEYSDRFLNLPRIVAADLSPGMVEAVKQTKTSNESSKLWKKVEFGVWSVDDMSAVSDNSFSHIIASLVMFFSSKPEAAFKEAYRVLAPNGVIGMTSFKENEWMKLLNVAKKVRTDAKEAPGLPATWASEGWIRTSFEKARFRDIEVKELNVHVELNETRPFAEFCVRSDNPVMSSVFENFTEQEKDLAVHLIIDHLDEKYPQRPAKMPGVLLVSSARK